MEIQLRFAHAELVAEEYSNFVHFAEDGMAFLGFPLTSMQADISEFMQLGPRLRMVMAQRGEAKSTLAALYAVWRIIQRPSTRVLIVSGGEKQASEVATLVIRLILQWDILEYLRPDKQAGDRSSIEAFDVHFALKGLDKSPSVACVGVTANLPGKRADLLIADDVETTKNGMTPVQRGQLLHVTKEFSSICTHGDILYLGTPQTKDSVYNTLPGRGFCVRIWPGRFPTPDEVEKYADKLAPYLAERIRKDPSLQTGGGIDGSKGQPADPGRYTEDDLCEKELDQGPEGFALQYMLDTSLADAERQQLRLSDFIVANFAPEFVPEILPWQAAPKYEVQLPQDFPAGATSKMYHAVPTDTQFVLPGQRMMFLDPAGGGVDEIGGAVSTAVGPYIHILDCFGLKGGLTPDNTNFICNSVLENQVQVVRCESNMGHGLFEINLRAEFAKRATGYIDEHGVYHDPQPWFQGVGVVGEYSTGQKERRIIDSLVSALQRHRLVLHKRVFSSDERCNKQHSQDKRTQYSVFYQLANITTDRNSLTKDDRVEALAGAVRHWKEVLAMDENKAAEKRKQQVSAEFMQNPMGYNMPKQKTTCTIHKIRSRRY